MNVKLKEDLTQEDIEVLIKYAKMNETVIKLEEFIKSFQKTVKCRNENSELWVKASDIYYIESVDKHTFVYCESKVYFSELRLYQLIDDLEPYGFVRISKSCIINITMLESIRPLVNSRLEALLSNGERVNVTRKFIPAIRKKLEAR